MKNKIEQLILSEDFRALVETSNRFNPFSALGINKRELNHSNLIAYFFNPYESHHCSDAILKAFLLAVYRESLEVENGFKLADFLSITYDSVNVYREFGNIDIVIDFVSAKTVVAIEHKIDAVERDKQIQDYQAFISEYYKHYSNRMILFLTPEGRNSSTADPSSEVPCYSISYRCIAEALEKGREVASGHVESFLDQTIYHIKEDIMGDGETKEIARKIWSNKDYADALNEIIQYRPCLEDIQDGYEKKVEDYISNELGSKVTLYRYPIRNSGLKEIKFHINSWAEIGLEFTFMFYMYDDRPAVRVFLWHETYSENIDQLFRFGKLAGHIVDPDFKPVKDWSCWRRVFIEDDYPEESYFDDFAFNDKTIDRAMKRIKNYIDTLSPVVEKMIK